ncbi:MAG: hypothetical protein Q8O56_13535 [Solirubrobacteraceae bacterium]|nr:hypothetical protein [Solirubrobacteraceae bacterium]
MKKVARKITTSFKDLAGKVKTSFKPLYLIPLVLVLGLFAVFVIVFVGGNGDDDAQRAGDPTLGFGEGDPSQLPGSRRPPPKQAPRVRTGLLNEARAEGVLAVAQARGTIVSPARVRIRISAAPKQTVRVNWQLGCYKDRKARIGRGEYRARTPDVREVRVPVSGAETCIATAGAHLSRSDRSGRIKVAVIAG